VKFTEYDVSLDQQAAEEMVRVSGQMGVPVIVIDGQVVVGFDRARIQSLLAGGKIHFGLKVADADRIAQKQGAIPVFGALVGEVARGSLGEKAGLNPGDIITEISGRRISNAADVEKVLGEIKPGSVMNILFLRGDNARKSEIVV
jgi:S1-C subfamily serine protease